MEDKCIRIDSEEVPIPKIKKPTRSKGQRLMYPFKDLEVGQSFFVEGVKARNISGCAAYAGKILKRRFIARSMDDGVRVWRME